MYWDVNNLHGWAVSQTLLVNGFKLRYDKFNFFKDFIQSYDENSYREYILEVKLMFSILRNYKRQTVIYHSYQKA